MLRENSVITSTRELQGRTINQSAKAAGQLANPVACVDEAKRLLTDVCEILFGVTLEGFFGRDNKSKRKTWCFTCNKGILGHAQAVVGVLEDHAKGTLHFHLVFLGGLSPGALKEFAAIPDLCAGLVSVLDSQYKSQYPQDTMLRKLVKDHVQFKVPANVDVRPSPCAMLRSPQLLESYTQEGLVQHYVLLALSFALNLRKLILDQTQQNSGREHGRGGQPRCRFAMAQSSSNVY